VIEIGGMKLALVFVDWKEVCIRLLISSLRAARPAEESDSAFTERIKTLFGNASPSAKRAALDPIYLMLFHTFEYLPEQLTESLVQLLAEGYYEGIKPVVARRGLPMQARPAFADDMLKRQRRLILARLPKSKSSNTRTKPRWKDPTALMAYARLVNSRKLLTEIIKKTHDRADGADDWRDDLADNSDYQLLRPSVPPTTLEWALRRVAEDVAKRDREPLALACEMARQELGLDTQKPQTLRNYYLRGVQLSKRNRR
jgi:hypothetical protein